MKLIVLAAALTIAGAAAAQKAPDTSPQTVGEPRGGYQPNTPLFSSPPQPGQPVVFVPNPQTPSEAYPPPPPLQHYPFCKRGQFDHCMQRGG
jgi:hypothetical protein